MPKKSYYEGWGYSDNVRLVVKGETKNRNDFYKEFKKSYPTEQIEKSGQKSVEAYVSETQVPMIKKLAKFFNLMVIYRDGGSTNNQEVARTILSQLGGQNKLVVMTGANTFVAIPNGLSFKIKNRKVNYIKITLNVNDLYDVVFGKILSGSLKVISEFKDIYNDQLKTLFEKETGMYLKLFRKGGALKDDNNTKDLIFSEGGNTPEKLVYVLYGVKPTADDFLNQNGKRNRSWWQSNLDLEKSKELLEKLKQQALIKEYLIYVGDKSNLKFKDGGEIEEDDLFANYDKQPLKVQKILADFSEDDVNDYEASERLITALNKVGYTCEYGMDGELFGLRKLTNEELVQKLKNGEVFKQGGNVVLSSNKNISNLSIEQSKIVRTPEFKNWFGNWQSENFKRNHKAISEISNFNTISLDENGEPKIWYRASLSNYSEIKQKNIYLGAKSSYVKQYGNDVKMFFVKSNKTIFIDNEDIERKHLGVGFEYLAEYINQENKIPLTGANYNKLKQIFSNQPESEYLAVWEYFTELENSEVLNLFKSWFKQNGFDSIQYWETGKKNNFGKYPIGLITLYFGDTPIKLANGKNTTFDSNTPNIAFAEGGMPQGLSIADANPYIAGAKAVQGIAPSSVSALDQRIASRINPDPNRPVFFNKGGKTNNYGR